MPTPLNPLRQTRALPLQHDKLLLHPPQRGPNYLLRVHAPRAATSVARRLEIDVDELKLGGGGGGVGT